MVVKWPLIPIIDQFPISRVCPYGCVHTLRRWNTRYKPQLVAQHCFVSSFGSMFRVFHPEWSTCRTTNICCRLKKVVAKSKAQVYFEQQTLALLLVNVFIKLATWFGFTPSKSTHQRACCISSTRDKCFCCATSWSRMVKNRNHRSKTCNETMLHDKLRVFALVCRILPPQTRSDPI